MARASFGFSELNGLIDELDTRIPGRLQNRLYLEVQRALRFATAWFLRHEALGEGLKALVQRYRSGLAEVETSLADALPQSGQVALAERQSQLESEGVPPVFAARISSLSMLKRAPDVVHIASRRSIPIATVAAALYQSGADLGVERLITEAERLKARDFIERQAINRLIAHLFHAHRGIVMRVIADTGGAAGAWPRWRADHTHLAETAIKHIDDILASRPFDLAASQWRKEPSPTSPDSSCNCYCRACPATHRATRSGV